MQNRTKYITIGVAVVVIAIVVIFSFVITDKKTQTKNYILKGNAPASYSESQISVDQSSFNVSGIIKKVTAKNSFILVETVPDDNYPNGGVFLYKNSEIIKTFPKGTSSKSWSGEDSIYSVNNENNSDIFLYNGEKDQLLTSIEQNNINIIRAGSNIVLSYKEDEETGRSEIFELETGKRYKMELPSDYSPAGASDDLSIFIMAPLNGPRLQYAVFKPKENKNTLLKYGMLIDSIVWKENYGFYAIGGTLQPDSSNMIINISPDTNQERVVFESKKNISDYSFSDETINIITEDGTYQQAKM